MLAEYDPNVKATISFLQLIGVKVNYATVNDTLKNHPDWPSLLCVSDSLRSWHVPNAAGRIPKDDIAQLPVPFLAPVLDEVSPIAIVKDVSETKIGYFPRGYQKYTVETREDFFKKWGGVYLIAEPNQKSGEDEYSKVKKQAYFSTLLHGSLFLVLLFQALYFLHDRIQRNSLVHDVGAYSQLLTFFCGFFVSILLLWYEVDHDSPLLQKVCTGFVKANCHAVLTSPRSKLFKWLSWSEVGFIYFTGGLLMLLLPATPLISTMGVLGWLSILAIPYTIFSVWYQWRVAKQWCPLCLSVQFLLVASALNSILDDSLHTRIDYSFSQIIGSTSFYLIPALIWASIKPLFAVMQGAKNTKRDYLQIKFNEEIFDLLLKRQPPAAVPVDGLGIDLGNTFASNTLIKVCNPYCGPCAKAHRLIEDLLQQHDNLHVKIIFTASNDINDIKANPVRHLMAVAGRGDERLTKQALDDWYLTEKKDYDVFASKYPMKGELANQGNRLEAMSIWCAQMKVVATPTIFFNGYRLPKTFSIADLKYFLSV